MAYSFARVGAVIRMKVGDYFVQGRRRWVRLHEKGGKEHDVPCHHSLDQFLDEYIAAAGIAVTAISSVRRREKRACSHRCRFPNRTPIAWFSAARKPPSSRRVLAIIRFGQRASLPI
jgi:integrase